MDARCDSFAGSARVTVIMAVSLMNHAYRSIKEDKGDG